MIGNGLLGSYYSDVDFTYFVAQRVDATVGFTWGSGVSSVLLSFILLYV